jgi:hypothetical protein
VVAGIAPCKNDWVNRYFHPEREEEEEEGEKSRELPRRL